MSSTEGATHLSIGEVLALLQDDFPDVTISKIRFLESQGLISPERTASGYRKFYDDDIRRLQWVLRQQKERFLPLKVIKSKLDAGEDVAVATDPTEGEQPSLFGEADPPPAPMDPPRPAAPPASAAPDPSAPAPTAASSAAPAASVDESGPPGDPAAWLAALQEGPKRRSASRPLEPPIDLATEPGGTYTLDEVCEKSGLSPEVVGQLVDFGLVVAGRFGGDTSFDDTALEVARTAAVFVSKGIEARHLRAYKLAAEREAALIEQLTLPLLRQRNPTSRAQAAEAIGELTRHGGELRHALLRQALRGHVQPR